MTTGDWGGLWPDRGHLRATAPIATGRLLSPWRVAYDGEGLRVRTAALAQFGLPELEARDVTEDIVADVNRLLLAVAQHLLRRYPPGYDVKETPTFFSRPS